MQRPSWASRPFLIIAAALLSVAAVVVALAATRGTPTIRGNPLAGAGSEVPAKIPATGGVTLSAEVITPTGAGPFPLLVMPGSWGAGANEYTVAGEKFASEGYQVVAYAQRGAKGSGGQNDLAGSATRDDAGTVIDWALAHTRADRNKIGMLGVSYGAGISLLTAAQDKRVRAVVAMSGWADMLDALAPNHTPNVESLHQLLDGRLRSGTLAQAPRELAASLSRGSSATVGVLGSLTGERSADSLVSSLNANRPAIMLANAYQDSILDPAQIVPFFDELTTPKRLQLAPGDHGGPEYAGLLGQPDVTFTNATQWLDHYLRGEQNGIDRADPVQLQDEATGAWHGYPTWPSPGTTVQLSTPNVPGDIAAAGAVPWRCRLTTGTDSGAASGPPFTLAPHPYRAPTVAMSAVKSGESCQWSGAPLARAVTFSGSPRLRLDVAASTPSTTFYAYLYDVDPGGTATLMSFAPDTVTGGAVSTTLRPMSWTVAAGHHVALVIDTVDARYASAAPSGSTLTLSSTSGAPATLTL